MSDHEPRMTGTKICAKCLRDLPVIHFPVCKRNKDGLNSYCRECNADFYKSKHLPNKHDIRGRFEPVNKRVDRGNIS